MVFEKGQRRRPMIGRAGGQKAGDVFKKLFTWSLTVLKKHPYPGERSFSSAEAGTKLGRPSPPGSAPAEGARQPEPALEETTSARTKARAASLRRHDAVELGPILVRPAGRREDRTQRRRHVEPEVGAVVWPDQAHRARDRGPLPAGLNTSVARPSRRSRASLRAPPPSTAATAGDPSTGSAITPALTTEAWTEPSGRATARRRDDGQLRPAVTRQRDPSWSTRLSMPVTAPGCQLVPALVKSRTAPAKATQRRRRGRASTRRPFRRHCSDPRCCAARARR